MPVRLTIQASSTPRRSAIGPLGTTSGGTWWPSPRMRAVRGGASACCRCGSPRGRSCARSGGSVGATHGRAPRRGSRLGQSVQDALAEAGEHLAGADLDEAARRRPRAGPARSRASGRGVSERRSSSARTSSNGCVVAHEKTGKARLVQLGLVERGAERLDGRLHARRVERAGDVERRARGGRARGRPPRPSASCVARAGEDDLAGRVVVGDGDAGGLGDRARPPRRSRRSSASIEPTVVGLGHQLAAQHDELERVVALEHAGGGERGQLAERVAGGRAAASRSSASQPARLAQKIAGWAKRVDSLGARERVLAHERDAALEQVGGAIARRGPASRVSGCPGRGTARPGQLGSVIKVTPNTLSGRVRGVTAIRATIPPGRGVAVPPACRAVTSVRTSTALR